MKKILLVLLSLLLMTSLCLTACNIFGENPPVGDGGSSDDQQSDNTQNACEHTFTAWDTVREASCIQTGLKTRLCTKCGKKEEQHREKKPHTEVIDPAIPGTCEISGRTQGSHCSVCGTIIIAQKEVEVDHTYVNTEAIESTCTTDGRTFGSYCSVCNSIFATSEIIPAGHKESAWIIDKAHSVNEDGKKHTECISCGITVKQETVVRSGSTNLEYIYDSSTMTCIVSGYDYSIFTDEIHIGGYSNGYKVVGIKANAFAASLSGWSAGITKVVIGDTVTEIGDSAFEGCNSLASVVLSNNLTKIGKEVFYGCSALTEINIPSSVTEISDIAFASCTSLKNITLTGSIDKIGNGTFSNCSSLENIDFKHGVRYIGNQAFYGCAMLKSIFFPEGLIGIGEDAFYNCSTLEEIDLPDTVTSIGEGIFYLCTSLTTVNLPASITAIPDTAFYGCKKLESINFNNQLKDIGRNAFWSCESLKNIQFPESIKTIGYGAFYGCKSLTEVNLSSNAQVESLAFANCTGIISANVYYISSYAFEGCTSLQSVKIHGDIPASTFSGCVNLVQVIISKDCKYINQFCFEDCEKLTKVYYEGNKEDWNKILVDVSAKEYFENAEIIFNANIQ